MDTAITINNASLRFRSYRNPSPGLKEAVIRQFSKKHRTQMVTEFDALKNINLSLKV